MSTPPGFENPTRLQTPATRVTQAYRHFWQRVLVDSRRDLMRAQQLVNGARALRPRHR